MSISLDVVEMIRTSFQPIDQLMRSTVTSTVLQSISPENIDIVTTGKSFEGQDLKVLRINKDETGSKKIVWIDGGTHAREWIGVSTAMYLAASLATARQACDIGDASRCSEDMERMFKKLEFRIQPVVNPDGYMYAHTEDRMWRKTRSTNSPSPWSYFCRGVDPNRNLRCQVGWCQYFTQSLLRHVPWFGPTLGTGGQIFDRLCLQRQVSEQSCSSHCTPSLSSCSCRTVTRLKYLLITLKSRR